MIYEVPSSGREKGLHSWDELFLTLRTQDLVFEDDLALQHEAVGPGHLWKPWPQLLPHGDMQLCKAAFEKREGQGHSLNPQQRKRCSLLWT